MLGIRGDVVRAPAQHLLARKFPAVLEAEREIARRMTFAAVAERRGEVGAAVPLR